MRTTTIKKGTHSSFRLPKIIPGTYHMYVYTITFTESCVYDLGNEDQLDVNKLFGIGYFPSHHKNSVRFGWRYDLESQKIEILSYYYKNGKRFFDTICFVNIGESYTYVLAINHDYHELSVHGSSTLNDRHYYKTKVDVDPQSVGYLLRPYFGGNQKAPHDINIKIK